jgi:hypothetical protein
VTAMQISKIIVGLAVGVVLFLGLVFLAVTSFSSRYLQFMAEDKTYFAEVAHACDSILREHPVTSKDTVTLFGHLSLPDTVKLSAQDSSLPKVIRALHPDMILVSTNRVFIEIPPERMGGFTIAWKQDDMRSNYRVLQSNGDGLVKTVYEENEIFLK